MPTVLNHNFFMSALFKLSHIIIIISESLQFCLYCFKWHYYLLLPIRATKLHHYATLRDNIYMLKHTSPKNLIKGDFKIQIN